MRIHDWRPKPIDMPTKQWYGMSQAPSDTLTFGERIRPSRSMTQIYTVLFLAMLATGTAIACENTKRAKKIFNQYVTLAGKFDPAVADLYSDAAKIKNTRIYPDGRRKVMSFDAKKYKALIRIAMPLAKARGDTNKYTEVKYIEKDSKVTITATRFSNLKKYSSPLTLVVGADNDGKWRTLEVISRSRPLPKPQ
jgi:hypothetical protein